MTEQTIYGGGLPPLLQLLNVSKSFGGIAALKDVDFTLMAGEIHGLVGENGAGKSTTMKIIAGVYSDFQGEMRVDNKPVHFRSARDALAAGIGMVHQELSTIPDLTVAENVFLGHQPLTKLGTIDWARINKQAAQLVSSLGLDIDPKTRMGSLPVGLQQLVELSRVLFSGARIIILDEPTAALGVKESGQVLQMIRDLRDRGLPVILISHNMPQVFEVADRIHIQRLGRRAGVVTPSSVSITDAVAVMTGALQINPEHEHLGPVTR